MDKAEAQALFAEVRENQAKLKNCAGHRIDPAQYKFGQRTPCLNCGGTLRGEQLAWYIDGWTAAGRDPNEVWPGIDKPASTG